MEFCRVSNGPLKGRYSMLVCHNQSSKRTFKRLKVGRHTESSEGWGEDLQSTWAKYANDTTQASEWLINALLCPKKSAAKLLECPPPCAAGDKDGCLLSAPWRKWAAIFVECTRGSLLRQPTATEYCCQTYSCCEISFPLYSWHEQTAAPGAIGGLLSF